MNQQKQLEDYIYKQLQSGLNPDEIAQQLQGADWSKKSIDNAFAAVRSTITPSANEQSQSSQPQDAPQNDQSDFPNKTSEEKTSDSEAAYQPMGKKRGRIKTAWLLLKQSLKVLKNNKQLLRYPFMGGLLSILITVIFGFIMFINEGTLMHQETNALGDEELNLTGPGMAVAFVYYVIVFFAVFIYNTGLAAHTLDIFRGKSGAYAQYMKLAWSKKGVIFVYSLITATVGLILRAIERRSRLFGFIVSRIFGVLWTLANLFTIPIIAETDSSAPSAIKQSSKLFISRWGENIAARITFGGLAFLAYLLLFIPVMVLLAIISSALGVAGLIFFAAALIIGLVFFFTVETAASNILSTALYYYAQYQQVPAAFDSKLLNTAFIPKKNKKRLFGKNKS